jgi:hypothetical protein
MILYLFFGCIYLCLLTNYFYLTIPIEIRRKYKKVVFVSDSLQNKHLTKYNKKKLKQYFPRKECSISAGTYKKYKNQIPSADLVILFELNFIQKWWYNKYPKPININHPNLIRISPPFFINLNPYVVKERKFSFEC